MTTLEDAVTLAAQVHRGQKDKAGRPYILHSLRVMLAQETDLGMTAAVLHDVVEDTGLTIEDLRRMGYPKAVLELIDLVTRREGEAYDEYIERARRSPLAKRIKLADLEDNMDVSRLPEVTEKDRVRLAKYAAAKTALLEPDSAGDSGSGNRKYLAWGGIPFLFDESAWRLYRLEGEARQVEITDTDSFAMIRRNAAEVSENKAWALAAELEMTRKNRLESS